MKGIPEIWTMKAGKTVAVLMKLGNINPEEALERYGTKDCMIFKGKYPTGRTGYKYL